MIVAVERPYEPEGRICEGAVHLRPARGDAVKLPLPRHPDHPVAVRPRQVKVRKQDCLFGFTRFGQRLARKVDNLRVAREAESSLFADTVRRTT